MLLSSSTSGQIPSQPPPVLAEARNKIWITPSKYIVVIERDKSTKADRIVVNGKAMDLSAIYAKFAQDFDGTQTDIIIEAAADVRYGTVLTVMVYANDAGFNKFGLATRVANANPVAGKITGFQKDLDPSPKSSPSPSRQGANIEVLVNSNNVVYLDGNRTSLSNLYTGFVHYVALHRKHSGSGDAPHVALAADTDASWQTIILILDAARQAGDDDIGFVTE
jgi:biopolymer transport protein ExbD